MNSVTCLKHKICKNELYSILGLNKEVNNYFYWFLILCLQVKRETHTQYRYFNRQPNRNKNKEKQISLVSNNKTETYNKNGALQKKFYQ